MPSLEGLKLAESHGNSMYFNRHVQIRKKFGSILKMYQKFEGFFGCMVISAYTLFYSYLCVCVCVCAVSFGAHCRRVSNFVGLIFHVQVHRIGLEKMERNNGELWNKTTNRHTHTHTRFRKDELRMIFQKWNKKKKEKNLSKWNGMKTEYSSFSFK